jgi:hypothetical protein
MGWLHRNIKHYFNYYKAITCGAGTTDSLHYSIVLSRHLLLTLNYLGHLLLTINYLGHLLLTLNYLGHLLLPLNYLGQLLLTLNYLGHLLLTLNYLGQLTRCPKYLPTHPLIPISVKCLYSQHLYDQFSTLRHFGDMDPDINIML